MGKQTSACWKISAQLTIAIGMKLSSHVHTVSSYLLQVKFLCVKTNVGACCKCPFWAASCKCSLSKSGCTQNPCRGAPSDHCDGLVGINEPKFISGLSWSRFLKIHFLYSRAGDIFYICLFKNLHFEQGEIKSLTFPTFPFPIWKINPPCLLWPNILFFFFLPSSSISSQASFLLLIDS